jgi:membrane protease YdiL (CAAX protease family)
MNNEENTPQCGANLEQQYASPKFTLLFAILIGIICLTVIVQEWSLRNLELPMMDESILRGDILIKTTYALEGWSTLISDIQTKKRLCSEASSFKRAGMAFYKHSAKERKSAEALRRLIILDNSNNRQNYFEQLRRIVNSDEAKMWRALYLESKPLTPKSCRAYSATIRDLDLRWFEHLVLAKLYQRCGMIDKAKTATDTAYRKAQRTVVVLMVLLIAVGILGVIGVAVLILCGRKFILKIHQQADYPLSPGFREFKSSYLLSIFIVYWLILTGSELIGEIILAVAFFATITLNLAVETIYIYVKTGSYLLGGVLAFAYLLSKLSSIRWPLEAIGLKTKEWKREVLAGVGGYACILPLLLVGALITQWITGPSDKPTNLVNPLIAEAKGISELIALFLLVGIAAPFFEEIFFRGVMLTSFRTKWAPLTAVVLSAATFALMHPVNGFLPIFGIGLVLAGLTYERKSLLAPMVAHSLNNIVAFLLLLLLMG